jgi:mono/diheme cytochrome c family protein/uncharacterized membrane protein
MKNKNRYIIWGAVLALLGILPMLFGSEVPTAGEEEVIVPSFVRFISTIFGQDPGDPADFFLFVGRFHPLVLHLPIGMLVVAFIMQAFSIWKKRDDLHFPYCFCLGCSFVFSIIAVVCGSFLSMSNDYNPDLINRHGWGGMLFSLLVGIAFYLKFSFIRSGHEKKSQKKASLIVMFIAINVMGFVGHDGGSLTHGEEYIWKYAPDFARAMTGRDPKPTEGVNPEGTVYKEIIAKFMEKNCTECHGKTKTKGKLRLDEIECIKNGGKHDDLIVYGKANKSLMVELMTTGDEDEIMPPDGKLPDPHIELIKWWINTSKNDADLYERKVKDANVPAEFIQMFDKKAKKAAHAKKAAAATTEANKAEEPKAEEPKAEEPKAKPVAATSGIDFAKKIAPILEARCVKCHGEKKQKGEYRLDKAEHIFTAGESEEKSVVKNKPEVSYLLKLIKMDEEEDDVMPPKGGNLTAEQIASIEQWIKEGAKFPADAALQDKSPKKK